MLANVVPAHRLSAGCESDGLGALSFGGEGGFLVAQTTLWLLLVSSAVELARAGGRFRRARRLDGAPGPDGWERWGLEAEVEAGAATRILCRVTDDSLNTATVELGKKGQAPGSGGEL